MDDVIFSEDSQIIKIQYLRNYAIKMHRVNAKKFFKFFGFVLFPNDLFYKIHSDSDFIAPLRRKPSLLKLTTTKLGTVISAL